MLSPTQKSTHATGWLARLLVVGVLFTAMGCPSYTDKHTGTYREVDPSARGASEAIELDLFRFGENAAAVIRFYERVEGPGAETFSPQNQTTCAWTSAEQFREDAQDWNVRLFLDDAAGIPRSRLLGQLRDGGESLIVSLYQESGLLKDEPYQLIEDVELERLERRANPDCDSIKDYFVEFSFPPDPSTGEAQGLPTRADRQIENPVFAIAWLGVEPLENSGQTLLTPVDEYAPAFRLDTLGSTNFDAANHTLEGAFTVAISAPNLRMENGDTSLSLGHFAVIDDDTPVDEIDLERWRFDWEPASEKLVASSLQPASRPSCPDQTNRFGRALLFVEDSIWDLDPSLLERLIEGEEAIDRDSKRHFFVVDVCAKDDKVLALVIDQPFFAGDVPLRVTDDFLRAEDVPLPRLNPYNFN